MLPDRYTRGVILAGTSLLPGRIRLRSRRRLMAGFYARMTRDADVVMAVHPKNGGTWLRAMIYRVYQQKYGLDTRRVVKSDEFHRLNPKLPRFVFSNGHYSYESAVARTLDALPAAQQPSLLLLMARHPGDIAVSWYHQFTRRISERKRDLIVADMTRPIDYKTVTLAAFIDNDELGLPALIAYHNRWAARIAAHPHGLIVRYEDLRTEPARYLRQVMEHIGETVDDALIDDAVEFAGVDNLRKLEAERYFPNSGLRQKKRGNPDTVKVRRAKVGGFRDDVSAEQAELMDAMIAERLDPVFGYGPPPAER